MKGNELAHYSKAISIDIMYKFKHGLEELEGIANRTDFDLGSHTKFQEDLNISSKVKQNTKSKSRLAIQDSDNNWQIPYVIGSAGVDRGVLAVLNEAYRKEIIDNGKEQGGIVVQTSSGPN